MTPKNVVTLFIEISNTGPSMGAEVVQVYFHALEPPLDRPEQALCGFRKVVLQPDETQVVEIPIEIKNLHYYNPINNQWALTQGAIELRVGTYSRDFPLNTIIQVV